MTINPLPVLFCRLRGATFAAAALRGDDHGSYECGNDALIGIRGARSAAMASERPGLNQL